MCHVADTGNYTQSYQAADDHCTRGGTLMRRTLAVRINANLTKQLQEGNLSNYFRI